MALTRRADALGQRLKSIERVFSEYEDAKRKLQFDLYYLKEMSFEMDMIILFRTVGTFLRGGI